MTEENTQSQTTSWSTSFLTTSALKPEQRREGLVFKALDGQTSFKAISNQYLLKQKD